MTVKHHKFISLCIGLAFLIVVQKFAEPVPIFRFLLPAFLFYAALAMLYNWWYLRQIQKYNFWILLRSLMVLASAFGLFFILPSEFLRGLFLIPTVAIITLLEIILGNQAENLLLNETLLVIFGIFFYFFAAYHYAPAYHPLYLAGIFLSVAAAARSFYEFTPWHKKTKLVGAMCLGLFCAELFWALNFLPFHFSVLSVILFNFFYFCLIINYYHLFHNLNFKKIQFHLILMIFCAALVLMSTPWSMAS